MNLSDKDASASASALPQSQFASFFQAINGFAPFQWQVRLAADVCEGNWPDYIKLPTSSGKTAVIEMAVFALAFRALAHHQNNNAAQAPRRIFFVVDRRIVVSEAHQKAVRIAEILADAASDQFQERHTDEQQNVLRCVAQTLKSLSGDENGPPLDCFELRGGIYRDDAWVRSPTQPTVLTSTVDQVGSRLLFRGYGVSDRNLPIHAALTANDSLIILDEAHCSKPFSQTLSAIQKYRQKPWAEQEVTGPFQFVQMTATPPGGIESQSIFQLNDQEQQEKLLAQRHDCPKPTQLVLAKGAKNKKYNAIISHKLAEQAQLLTKQHGLTRIAVVVNRVAIAREVFSLLQQEHPKRVDLMIGRMRPWDRDRLTETLQHEFGSRQQKQDSPDEATLPRFVVATQCIEVGADLDFDGMVSQCASIDALQQRFGRLNRMGNYRKARGVVVIAEGDAVDPGKLSPAKPLDPVYGNALALSWDWLQQVGAATTSEDTQEEAEINFGVHPFEKLKTEFASLKQGELTAPSFNAPVLLPAHLDLLCQTSPRPAPDPVVAPFLHGLNRNSAEVRVCWRADFDFGKALDAAHWISAVAVCPPSSAETMTVPLVLFQRWLRGQKIVDDSTDVLGEISEESEENGTTSNSSRTVLVWRGNHEIDGKSASFLVRANNASQISPNDTLVLPVEFGGWKQLGHIPDAPFDPSLEPEVFPAGGAVEWQQLLEEQAHLDEKDATEVTWQQIVCVDIAEDAFFQSRAKSILRVHPKLPSKGVPKSFWHKLLDAAKDPDSNLSIDAWKQEIQEAFEVAYPNWQRPKDIRDADIFARLSQYQDHQLGKGSMTRYHHALAWITGRHGELGTGVLPLASFGETDDSLSHGEKLSLAQHLADVVQQAETYCNLLAVPREIALTTQAAAAGHDLGKADPRFQAMLLGCPLVAAHMQPTLWAKSPKMKGRNQSLLPQHFRHEMLSLAIVQQATNSHELVNKELLFHSIAAHHGYARPWAPVCIDEEPPSLDMKDCGLLQWSNQQRSALIPAHRLDSGLADRFWELNRQYGWWGLAYCETLLRLADWTASARPGQAKRKPTNEPPTSTSEVTFPLPQAASQCELIGIDGANPLGFLAALGAFRSMSYSVQDLTLHWAKSAGAWRPVLASRYQTLDQDFILSELSQWLPAPPQLPLLQELGPNLTISGERFRELAVQVVETCHQSTSPSALISNRIAADFLAAFGCDLMTSDGDPNSLIEDTALRTMSGAGHQHFVAFMGRIIDITDTCHIRNTLFAHWRYQDEGQGAYMRWDPIDDRRHALRWNKPEKDPARTMRGANRLAIEALPLFTTAIEVHGRTKVEKLGTTGFVNLRRTEAFWTWPIWITPISLKTCQSLLQAPELRQLSNITIQSEIAKLDIVKRCVGSIFQSKRFTRDKRRNFTPATSI